MSHTKDRFFLMIIYLICLSSLTSCDLVRKRGNGVIVSDQRNLEGFHKLRIEGSYEIILQQGDKNEVILKTDENLIDDIITETWENTLTIRSGENIYSDKGVRILLRYVELDDISSSGASLIFTDGKLEARELKLSMSGIGMMEFDVELDKLEVTLSGAGRIKLDGNTIVQKVSLSGAGNYEAFELNSNECKIRISGIGGAKVNVEEKLDAQVSGVGGIEYIGDPDVKENTSGIGKIKKADRKST